VRYLVVATHRPLRDIAPYGYEKFTPLELGPISEEDALLLLTSRGLNEEEARWVIERIGKKLFPFHLQALGACLFDAKRRKLPPEEARKRALDDYHKQFSWIL
jgi:hypothetical protein